MERVSLYNPVIGAIVKTRLANQEKPVVVYLDKDACFICGTIPQGVFSVHDCCCTIACFTCTLNMLTAMAMADESNSVRCLECKKEVRTIIPSKIPAHNCRQRQQLLRSYAEALDVLTYVRNRRLQFERPSLQQRSSCRSFIGFYYIVTIVRKNPTSRARNSSIRVPHARAIVSTGGSYDCSRAQKYFNVYFLHRRPLPVPPAPFGPAWGLADGTVGLEAGGLDGIEINGPAGLELDGPAEADGLGCVDAYGPSSVEANVPQ